MLKCILSLKKRHITQYILITISLLVLSIVYVLIYNEYFNEKKLTIIQEQLEKTEKFKKISRESVDELITAQNNLNKYISEGNKNHLDSLLNSLDIITKNIEFLNSSELLQSVLKLELSESNKSKIEEFKISIDSIYKLEISPVSKIKNFQLKTFELKDTTQQKEVVIEYSIDSTAKDKFFHRFINAFKKNPDIKRDTVFIQTKYGLSLDTTKIKSDFDNIIQLINTHYLAELNKYQKFISKTHLKNNQFYQTYDNLIWVSVELMNIYENAIDMYNTELLNQYNEQNSKINSIRKYTTLGLILLIFIILVLLLHYTKKSFKYEIELNESNARIKEDLNFKSRLLGMLSHEVRSPLKIITIFIDKINQKTNDKRIKSYLDLISYTNNILLIQSNQILEYTKNQHSPVVLNEVAFELHDEINNILSIFTPFIASKGNTLESNVNILPNMIVLADRIKIHQLFSNILGNANKFTENGLITATVSTSIREDSILLKVRISDNGSGISKEDIEQIFEPYYRGVISDKIDNIGAGLGLSLCKEIVDAYNGNISVDSELNVGTTVHFELTLKQGNEVSISR